MQSEISTGGARVHRAVATPQAPPAHASAAVNAKKRKGLGPRPVFRVFQVTHRWLALFFGLLLLVIVVSGVALLYKSEVHRALHPGLFHHTAGTPVGFQAAHDSAQQAFPGMKLTGGQLVGGVYELADADSKTVVVDAATGRVNGTMNPNHGVFGFLDNLHECALSCEGYPGYIPALGKPIGWIFGEELTWSALLLGSLGLLLGFMVVSGLVVWWPGIRSMARGFKIRRGKGRYKLNYDLHKVIGAVALPFLAVWALTGAGFEFPFVEKVWYAVLPGESPPEPPEFESKPAKDRAPITMDAAIASASAAFPAGKIISVYSPEAGNAKGAWDVWLASSNDPYDHGPYPGNVEVHVDQFSGAAKLGYGAPGSTDTTAESLWERWNFPIHAGTPVDGWWRSLWLLLGLTPVLLAVTGVTTWLIRRRKGKRGTRLRAQRAAAAQG